MSDELKFLTKVKKIKHLSNGKSFRGPTRKSLTIYDNSHFYELLKDFVEFIDSNKEVTQDLLEISSKFGYFEEVEKIVPSRFAGKVKLAMLLVLATYEKEFISFLKSRNDSELF